MVEGGGGKSIVIIMTIIDGKESQSLVTGRENPQSYEYFGKCILSHFGDPFGDQNFQTTTEIEWGGGGNNWSKFTIFNFSFFI